MCLILVFVWFTGLNKKSVMRTRYWLLGFELCFCIACYDTKVDRLRLEVMSERIIALENLQQQLNDNLAALQDLVEALKANRYIVSVTEIPEGYSLLLSDQSVLTIYHGKKGEQGAAGPVAVPVISVRDSSDGHTYWTLEGEWLRNASGEVMRADGEPGKPGEPGSPGEPGEPGMIPQVRINAEEIWEISLDGGQTWTSTGVKAKGEKGDSGEEGERGEEGAPGQTIFAKNGVTIGEEYIEFTLADGVTRFRLPRYREWKLEFPQGNSVQVPAGGESLVPFLLTGAGGTPVVYAVGDHGWQAEIEEVPLAGEGRIWIKAPASPVNGTIWIFLCDGLGGNWTYHLTATIKN